MGGQEEKGDFETSSYRQYVSQMLLAHFTIQGHNSAYRLSHLCCEVNRPSGYLSRSTHLCLELAHLNFSLNFSQSQLSVSMGHYTQTYIACPYLGRFCFLWGRGWRRIQNVSRGRWVNNTHIWINISQEIYGTVISSILITNRPT